MANISHFDIFNHKPEAFEKIIIDWSAKGTCCSFLKKKSRIISKLTDNKIIPF